MKHTLISINFVSAFTPVDKIRLFSHNYFLHESCLILIITMLGGRCIQFQPNRINSLSQILCIFIRKHRNTSILEYQMTSNTYLRLFAQFQLYISCFPYIRTHVVLSLPPPAIELSYHRNLKASSFSIVFFQFNKKKLINLNAEITWFNFFSCEFLQYNWKKN